MRRRRLFGVLGVVATLAVGCESFGVDDFGAFPVPGGVVDLCGERWTDAAGTNFENQPTAIGRTWTIAPGNCGNNSLPFAEENVVAQIELNKEFLGALISCGFASAPSLVGNVYVVMTTEFPGCGEGCFQARGLHGVNPFTTDILLAPRECIISA